MGCYITVFHNLAVQTVWGDSALQTAYYKGLASTFQRQLGRALHVVGVPKPDIDTEAIPEPILDLREVFSKSRAVELPPHRPYDLAINLQASTVQPCGHL